MEVSGSIFAVKSNYFEYAKMLKYAKVDYLHIDIFQQESDFGIEQLLQFDHTYLPLDVHLIFESISEEDIQILNQANVQYLNIQYENLKDKALIAAAAKQFKGNFGIAVTSRTPLSVIDENINMVSQILFMCSEPGVSGAQFDEINFERIQIIHDKYPSLKLCADGGINNVIGEKMGKMGVTLIVSGSYLCKDLRQLDVSSYSLKFLNEKDVNVKRKMLKINSLPLVEENAIFTDIINVMNHYRLGLVFVVENGKLEGIVADGDVRRGFLSYEEAIFSKQAKDLMNKEPFIIESDKNMEEVFCLLSAMHRGIDVVPVVESGNLIGAIDLHIGL